MSTASEEILARYSKVEIETDAFGRAVSVKRLRPAQMLSIMRMADSEMQTPVNIMTIAASVTRIDDAIYTFPRNIAEMNSVVDVLDQEGITAATTAYMRLQGQGTGSDKPEELTDAVKNSSGALG